ncbi:ribonuclease HII [Methylicorpusculum sp.]|uniref:ribonuclease HII n=1 Tax=Methylicorpusculum sp. TaxID=2713644 RepID=UPI003A0FEFFA
MVRYKPSQKITKNQFEKNAWSEQTLICGIDEVGRGCLCGPVVTGAVILPIGKLHPLLQDSKILTETERLTAYAWITTHCWYGFGFAHHRIIDQHNIWQATLIAMKKALLHACAQCPHRPSAVLTDAMPLKLFDTSYHQIPVHFFTKGESKSSSIAAASIIAKVKRDALMGKFAPLFPGYQMEEHKGYGTPKHRTAVQEQNYSIIHRLSFLSNILSPPAKQGESHDTPGQQSLF